MSRFAKKQARIAATYRTRDESGNGECFAGTYRQALGMSPLPTTAPSAPAASVDPLLRSIAECEVRIAGIQAGTVRDDLGFWAGLLAQKQAELAAR
jgi:hypothetical protein